MTEEQIKEAISRHFVHLIASRRGFKCGDINPDHGVDLAVRRAVPHSQNGRTRYLDDGRCVDVQLKSTTESQLEHTNEFIKYDLEAKSYNDLVYRKNNGAITPLILVLLVLPDDPNNWLTVTDHQLVVRRSALWYRPPYGTPQTANTRTILIEIPAGNVVTLSFFNDLFQEAFQ